MVPGSGGILPPRALPTTTIEFDAAEFTRTGFRAPWNWYRFGATGVFPKQGLKWRLREKPVDLHRQVLAFGLRTLVDPERRRAAHVAAPV
jgi:hypothetical protein